MHSQRLNLTFLSPKLWIPKRLNYVCNAKFDVSFPLTSDLRLECQIWRFYHLNLESLNDWPTCTQHQIECHLYKHLLEISMWQITIWTLTRLGIHSLGERNVKFSISYETRFVHLNYTFRLNYAFLGRQRHTKLNVTYTSIY
jgi:hypothetical protein